VIFVSYAREDKEVCRRLVLMLGLVLGERGYDVWWDQTMVAGAWRDQIDAALDVAVAGLLLVSEYSLTSEFIMREELPRLLARGPVAPVYARPCPWRAVRAVADLQFLGPTDQALTEYPGDLAALLTDIAQQAPDMLRLPRRESPVLAPAPAPAAPARLPSATPPGTADRLGALHNVPELPANHFARPGELDLLRGLVLADDPGRPGGAVGTQGIGGAGKTVLATALARDPGIRRAFPDGVFWLVLGERPDPVAVQVALARTLGLAGDFRTEVDGRAVLTEALAGRRVLLVIDDAWSAAAAEALLVTGAGGRTVVTTRFPLILNRLHAPALPLRQLGPVDSLRFLAQATFHPAPLPAEADELAEALGGVLLALALVAATIAHGTSWADALAAVRKAGEVYEDDGFANQFRALQLAWGALPEDDRKRYTELAVFSEDAIAPVATVARLWRHTAGLDEPASHALCAALAQRSLLLLDGDGVRLHDQQRAFLLLQAADSALAHRQLLAAHTAAQAVHGRWSSIPDDLPYLAGHLVEHLVAAGEAAELQAVVTDPVWLLRRFHRDGPHAPEADLERALAALPSFRAGERALVRFRRISDAMSAVSTIGDRAMTMANLGAELDPRHQLEPFLPRVRLRQRPGQRDQVERVFVCHPAPETMRWPRWGGAWAVAWSPDGRQLVTGGADYLVRTWPVSSSAPPPATLAGHQAGVRSVAWQPGGRLVASGGDDGTARVWDAGDPGRPPVLLDGHAGSVWSVAWSPDGGRLATADSDGTIRVWDPGWTASPRPQAELAAHAGSAWSVAWSPDGRQVASGGADRTVRIWDVAGQDVAGGTAGEPREPVTLSGHQGWVWSVAWSPDGQRVASAGDTTVRVWPAAGGAPLVLSGHVGLVWSVAWSPDGTRLASGGADRTVRVWPAAGPASGNPAAGDPATGSTVAPVVLAGHEDFVWSVAWSPDGQRIASAGQDEAVRVWHLEAGRDRPAGTAEHGRHVWAVDWSPDGGQLATGDEDGAVRIWDPGAPERPGRVVASLSSGVWAVAWARDGHRLAAGGTDRFVRIWNLLAPDAGPALLPGHDGLVRAVAWSPDGRRLATAGDDGAVRVWDAASPGQSPTVLRGHQGWVPSVDWSADGRQIASGGYDGTVRVWDTGAPGAPPLVLGGDLGRVAAVAWSPGGRTLAVGAGDGTIGLYTAAGPGQEDQRRLTMIPAHTEAVVSVAWSPDGRRLATAGEDRTVRIWDTAGPGRAPAAPATAPPSALTPVVGVGVGAVVFAVAWQRDTIAVGMATRWTVLTVEDQFQPRPGGVR